MTSLFWTGGCAKTGTSAIWHHEVPEKKEKISLVNRPLQETGGDVTPSWIYNHFKDFFSIKRTFVLGFLAPVQRRSVTRKPRRPSEVKAHMIQRQLYLSGWRLKVKKQFWAENVYIIIILHLILIGYLDGELTAVWVNFHWTDLLSTYNLQRLLLLVKLVGFNFHLWVSKCLSFFWQINKLMFFNFHFFIKTSFFNFYWNSNNI